MEEKNLTSEETSENLQTEENNLSHEVSGEAQEAAETSDNAENSLPQNKKQSLFDKVWEFIFPKKKPQETVSFLPTEEEYIKRLGKFDKFYRQFVAMLCVLAVLALLVMIHAYLWAGFGAVFLIVIIYINFTSDELFKNLGLTYTSIIGGIKILVARARYGTVFILPSNLMWLEVTSVGDRAFKSPKNADLAEVWLPATLESIGEDIFEDCPSLKKICFEGTEEKWENIQKKTDFSPYEIVYNVSYPLLPKKSPPPKSSKEKNKKKK